MCTNVNHNYGVSTGEMPPMLAVPLAGPVTITVKDLNGKLLGETTSTPQGEWRQTFCLDDGTYVVEFTGVFRPIGLGFKSIYRKPTKSVSITIAVPLTAVPDTTPPDPTVGPSGPAGPAGAVGVVGAVGVTGDQGPSGVPGDQGPSGVPGASGPSGLSGPLGPQGTAGVQGNVGPAGTIGGRGLNGAPGVAGAAGAPGVAGAAGVDGATGVGQTGVTGPQGIQGIQGDTGLTGQTGVTGPQGIQGLTGQTGVTGPQGIQGVQGVQGVQGDTGFTGQTGVTGPQGIQGVQGDTGFTGQTGVTGPQGIQGVQGDTGLTGDTGVTGPQGVPGSQGDTGLQGNIGETGVTGPPGTTVHADLSGLTVDDHAQYALLAGRASQTLLGSVNASGTLTLNSTTHGTKGYVAIAAQNNTEQVIAGTVAPEANHKLTVQSSLNTIGAGMVDGSEVQLVIARDVVTSGGGPSLGFVSSSSLDNIGAAIAHERTGGNSRGKLHFATKASTVGGRDPVIRMTIDEDGLVGIGTRNPESGLHLANTGVSATVFIDGETGVDGIKFPDRTIQTTAAVTDHGLLDGLSDDDHAQYILGAGRSLGGGNAQTIYGGTGSSEDLTLLSTSHSTKGEIKLGTLSTTHKTVVRYANNSVSGSNIDVSEVPFRTQRNSDIVGTSTAIGFNASTNESNIGAAIAHENTNAQSQGKLHFATKGTTSAGGDIPIRMTIDDSGFVGIGTQDPTTALHVKGMIFTDGETGVEGIKFPDKTVQTTAAVAGATGPQGDTGTAGTVGTTGVVGQTGPQGPQGTEGGAGTLFGGFSRFFGFDVTTNDSDPGGPGQLKLNNATYSNVTRITTDHVDGNFISVTNYILSFSAGLIRIFDINDVDTFWEGRVTSVSEQNGGTHYWINVEHIDDNNTFSGGDSLALTYVDSGETGPAGSSDHGILDGLPDDDHIQYALLAGRGTSQTLIGGIASGNKLILDSTSNATKGSIELGQGNSTGDVALLNHTDAMASSSAIDISELQLKLRYDVNVNNLGTGIGFGISELDNIGAAIVHERTDTQSQGKLHFATKNTSGQGDNIPIRMTIDEDGNVGIGIQDPTTQLHLKNGTSTATVRFDNSGLIDTVSASGDITINPQRDLFLGSALVNDIFIGRTDGVAAVTFQADTPIRFRDSAIEFSSPSSGILDTKGVINHENGAGMIKYTSTTLSDWTDTSAGPTGVFQALDELASRIKALEP